MKGKTKAKLWGFLVLALVVAWFANPNCDWDWYNVKVTDKQVKMIDGKDVYLIFSVDDQEKPHVFRDEDTKLFMKLDSSNIYAQLQVGKRYRVKTVGWRLPMFSKYENILKVEPLPDLPGSAPAR
jgi:hypothetical protein